MGKLRFGILALVGCGRFGFEGGATGAPDGSPAGDGAIANPRTLACGEPLRFATNANGLTALAAAPTAAGFVIAAIDAGQQLEGWSYAWKDAALEPTAEHVVLGGDARTVGATGAGDDAIVVSVFGAAAPLGTTLYPIGDAFARRGPEVARGEIAGDAPVAASGDDSGERAVALLTIDPLTAQVDVRAVSALGATLGPPTKVVDTTENASSVVLAPAGTGYLATWISRAQSPNSSRLALLDPAFGVVAGPVTVNATAFDATLGQAAWAASAGRYLITWYEKNDGGGDDVWFQLRGENLEPIAPAVVLATNAYAPAVASDGAAFWIAYRETAEPQRLAAARVAADGTVAPRAVSHSGGAPSAWGLVTRAGQSVLVWSEQGGSGPDLYLDPFCE
jgi:hypothetical protein